MRWLSYNESGFKAEFPNIHRVARKVNKEATRLRKNAAERARRSVTRQAKGLTWAQEVVLALKLQKGTFGEGVGWQREGGPVVHQIGGRGYE